MPLLNYTTTVTVENAVAKIQAKLVKAGARGVASTYDDDGVLVGMSFVVRTPFGEQAYSLPANVERVRAVLLRQKVQPRYRTVDHAARVAWKILHDWMSDAQGTTVYQRYVEQRSAAAAIESGVGV